MKLNFRKAFCLLSLILVTATGAFAASPTKVADSAKNANEPYWFKFKGATSAQRNAIVAKGFAIEGLVDDIVYAFGTKSDLENAKSTGLLIQSMSIAPIPVAKNKLRDFPRDDAEFHNYSELMKALNELVAANADIVSLSSIGKSVEGRDIPLLTFSTDGDDKSRPAVFYMGGHHAREHLSVEVPLNFAKYLASEYKLNNLRVRRLLTSRTIYIAPMINPDGAEFDITGDSYHLWRKNRNNAGGGQKGIDLNRNYGFMWGTGGSSADPGNDTFKGPTPFSEPETQAVRDFVKSHDNINILLSFHTFSKLILYPWGHKNSGIEDQADFEVHKIMAERMAKWNGYKPMQSSGLYIASGDTTDWSYGELKVISFTFELDPELGFQERMNPEMGFYPGAEMISPAFQKNLEPCLYLLENAANPYAVRGQ